MSFIEFKVKKVFRNGCSLVLPRSEDANNWQVSTVMIIRKAIHPQFSVAMNVEEITQGVSDNGIIYMDKRNSGPIEDENTVLVGSITPPKAEFVHLFIPDQSRLPAGDWSEVIRESVKEKLLDWGENLSFIVPSQLSAPYTVEGVINDTLPKSPVLVGKETKITISKHDEQTILQTHTTGQNKKQARAAVYLEQLKENTFDVLAKLKANLLDSYSKVYEFESNPRVVYNGIKQFFTGYRVISDELKETDRAIYGSIVVAGNYVDEKPTVLIEVHVSGKELNGKIQLWVYTLTEGQASKIIIEDIGPKVRNLVEGVKEETEVVTLECDTCGYPLDWQIADDEGWIKCDACEFTSKLPLRYRTK
ncbi:MAG: hypothetical protein ACXAEU_25145 [Candidatus Hodarchaeales archaeon]|jgi:hypothetical protein